VKVLKEPDEAKGAPLLEKIGLAKRVARLSVGVAVGGLALTGFSWILLVTALASTNVFAGLLLLRGSLGGVVVFGFSVATSLWWYMRYLGFMAELRELVGVQSTRACSIHLQDS
jgi:hypothetical protein